MRVCRNCNNQLVPQGSNLTCHSCYSAYLDMGFIKPYFRDIDFKNLLKESKAAASKSSHNCLNCKKQLALHFIAKEIQVESCFGCQKVWFDPNEIVNFQNYTLKRNQGKSITFESNDTLIPFTKYVFHKTLDNNFLYPGRQDLIDMATTEYVVNSIGNKVTDSNFFKKYPLLTFILIVGAVVGFLILSRPTR